MTALSSPTPDGVRGRLCHERIAFSDAAAFVAAHHRHHTPPVGHMFSLAAVREGELVGVVIVGRPVARRRDDGAMEIFGMKVVVRPDWPADRWALMPTPTNPIDAAACLVGATRSDIPGLWNAPGYPELTTGQLLSIASRMPHPMKRPTCTPRERL